MSNDLALKLDNVKKRYRLGVIGGGTLQGDLQSWWARIRGKEDPNTKIGENIDTKSGSFMALNGISFEVKKGERLGIIGGNGAGKSTTLKILSRVTAPTEGEVYINGRISSMLEVGTGFHPELTGRENIYLNGAILGMNKEEVDRKIEDIIEFSECCQFIDTPVKRYSSGMYVKLAFSVAAHLDSEILIMDEVLAVGDMKFQQKCLKKMQQVAETEGRTILYVSHNMNTIRQLCDRCVVLQKGQVIFDGDVEKAIEIYMDAGHNESVSIDFTNYKRASWLSNPQIKLLQANYVGKDSIVFGANEHIRMHMRWQNLFDVKDVGLRVEIWSMDDVSQATFVLTDFYSGSQGEVADLELDLDISSLVEASYQMKYTFFLKDEVGNNVNIDCVDGLCFEKHSLDQEIKLNWDTAHWGYVQMPTPKILSLEKK